MWVNTNRNQPCLSLSHELKSCAMEWTYDCFFYTPVNVLSSSSSHFLRHYCPLQSAFWVFPGGTRREMWIGISLKFLFLHRRISLSTENINKTYFFLVKLMNLTFFFLCVLAVFKKLNFTPSHKDTFESTISSHLIATGNVILYLRM